MANPEISATAIAASIAGIIASVLAIFLIISLTMWGLSKAFKLKNTKFTTAMLAATWLLAAYVLAGFLTAIVVPGEQLSILRSILQFALTAVAATLIVKRFHKLTTKKSAIIGILWTVAWMLTLTLIMGLFVYLWVSNITTQQLQLLNVTA